MDERILRYYSRKDVQKKIVEASKDREVGVMYGLGGFGKRPDIIQFENDVLELARQGATSFHISEERWSNPLLLQSGMTKTKLDDIRIGWDCILDIDTKFIEYAKIAADLVVKALKFHDIKNIGLKFSGNSGFHIGIPFEAFPDNIDNQEIKLLFPDGVRVIAEYLKTMVEDPLREKILKMSKVEDIAKSTGKDMKELVKNEIFDPFSVVEIDSVLISSRHMYRAPYSVAHDEPILIKKEESIEIVKMGEFVDQFFDKESVFQDKDISNLNLQVISSNLKNLKNRFSRINKIIRHEINEKLFNIKLEGGRTVKITSGHSLFKLKEGHIEIVRGNRLKEDDFVVVAKKLPSFAKFKEGDKIMISKEILPYLSNREKTKMFLSNFKMFVFNSLYKHKNSLGERKKNIYNWKRCKLIPLDIYEILIKKEPKLEKQFWNSKIKYSRFSSPTKWIDNKLIVNKTLMRILGYYTAEGHSDKSKTRKNRICFSFGAHENNLIKDCIDGVYKCFKIEPKVRVPHETSKQIIITSSTLRFIFDKLFNCGRTAKNKRIPRIVWIVEDNLKKAYLKSYLDGDGSIDKLWSRNNACTVSKKLKEDLCFLGGFLGLNYLLYNQTMFGISKKLSYANKFIISGKNEMEMLGFDSPVNRIKEGIINLFPLKEIGLNPVLLVSSFRNEYTKKNIIRRSKNWIKKNLKLDKNLIHNLDKFFEGDLAFLKVKEIKKEKSKYKYVYDLSVENDENFVGGNCILLHNSINEKKGLVSIPIKFSELKNFNLEKAKIENVKTELDFLPKKVEEEEANQLIMQAFDALKKKTILIGEEVVKGKSGNFEPPKFAVKIDYWAPCIKKGLQGLGDGKKRFLFILINYLRSLGWEYDGIEKVINDWNKKNKEQLKEGYIISQLNWHKAQKEKRLPPNCANGAYYADIGIECKDSLCNVIKNPVNYSLRRLRLMKEVKKKKRTKKK
ncbi:MAG: hypothetical protein KKG75_02555 [Nanoarchaeota archaeon]|nr:hypothetical protein [Nanoarchaeota archaeon]